MEDDFGLGVPGVTAVYRHYATLFFIFLVDQNESRLAMLDLIQIFVECLDKAFENVCELDLVFNADVAAFILDELIQDGLLIETDSAEVIKHFLAKKAESKV
jgi:AP-3 complex subunit sigma